MKPGAAALALVLALLPGCAGGGPREADGPEMPGLPTPDGVLLATGCEGLSAAVTLPPEGGPAGRPEGWQDPRRASRILTDLEACARLRVGPFERPVTLLVEAHDNAAAPQACVPPSGGPAFVLNRLWVDDAEVAAWLEANHGVPVLVGDFGRAVADLGPGAQSHEWRWAPAAGGQASSLAMLTTPEPATTSVGAWRYVWVKGDGLGVLDWERTETDPSLDPTLATGEMREPMLYAQVTQARPLPYLGQGNVLHDVSVSARLGAFEDTRCEPPS